jgi:hypothetical protein
MIYFKELAYTAVEAHNSGVWRVGGQAGDLGSLENSFFL